MLNLSSGWTCSMSWLRKFCNVEWTQKEWWNYELTGLRNISNGNIMKSTREVITMIFSNMINSKKV
jgi:hypothetical protein